MRFCNKNYKNLNYKKNKAINKENHNLKVFIIKKINYTFIKKKFFFDKVDYK